MINYPNLRPIEDQNRQLELLRKISRLLTIEKDLAYLLTQIGEWLIESLAYDVVWVGVPNSSGIGVLPWLKVPSVLAPVLSQDAAWELLCREKGPVVLAITLRQPVIFSQSSDYPNFESWHEYLRIHQLCSIAAFPLAHDGNVFGAIVLHSTCAESFNLAEVEMLSEISSNIGRVWQAIEDEQFRRRAERQLIDAQDIPSKAIQVQALELGELISSQSRDSILRIRKSDGKIMDANAAALVTYGFSREKLLTKNIQSLQASIAANYFPPEFDLATAEGALFETLHIRESGEIFPVEVSSRGMTLNGEVYLISSIRDITERKKSEEQMRLFQTAVAAAGCGVVITDSNGNITWVNEAFSVLSGYSSAEAIGKSPQILKSPYQQSELFRQLWSTIKSGQHWTGEIRNTRKDGTVYDEHLSITPVKDGQGNVSHFIGVIEDITLRKESAREMIQAHDFYLRLLESAPALIWRANIAGNCDWFNQTWLEFTGRTMAQELGDGWAEGVHPDDLKRSLEHYQCALNKREAFTMEYRLRRHDGEFRWIVDHGRPFKSLTGVFTGYIGYCFDIHDSKEHGLQLAQAKAALEQANSILADRVVARTQEITILSDVIEKSEMAFCISIPDGKLRMVNQALVNLTGYSRAELTAETFNWEQILTPPEWNAMQARFLENSKACRTTVRYETECLHKDGRRIPVEMTIQPILDSACELLHYRIFISEITERKEAAHALEIALKRADQANQAKSEFLASMSHEIRTPLNSILGFTQLLQRDPQLSEDVKAKINIINRNGESLLSTLNDILDLAKIESGSAQVCLSEFNLSQLCEELTSFFEESAKAKNLSITFNIYGGDNLYLLSDQEKIRKLLLNLLGNAVKFTHQGSITLTAKIIPNSLEKCNVELAVSDTGCGISAVELGRLFQKFEQGQAGKNLTGGTGLGLALCREYAKLLGGTISLTSELGVGSTFIVKFPAETTDIFPASKHAGSLNHRFEPANVANLRILIVDDNGDNLEFLSNVLKNEGFAVCTAMGGQAAISICAEWSPQLILMDTKMPNLDGLQTIQILRKMHQMAEVKIITISATAYESDRQQAMGAGADEFISKPVQLEALFSAISRQLKIANSLDSYSLQMTSLRASKVEKFSYLSLLRFPADWRNRLREAVNVADFDMVDELLKQVAHMDSEVRPVLEELAHRFAAEEILELLNDAENQNSPK
jgi:PAS domain S-box-containing protein